MPNEITIQAPNLTDYQKEIIYAPERFTVTEAATKVGKTFSHLWWLFEEAHKLKKIGANFWWIAPVYQQTEIAFNRLRRVVGNNSNYIINLSKLTIITPLLTEIHFKSAEKPDNLYGEDVYGAVFDEFTRAREEAWWALRTTLTKTKGKCKFIGNVKGKKNWGYRLGMKARQGAEEYKYFKITAQDGVNAGIITAEEVEQARKDLPIKVFEELYLAQASEDGSNPFGYEFIKLCTGILAVDLPVCYGIDLAKSVDFTVIIGLNQFGNVCYFDRFQRDWKQTKEIIQSTINNISTVIDSTGVGDPIVEEIQRACRGVEGLKFTSQSKQQLMEGLAVAIQNGKVTFPDGIIKEELESFEFEYTKTGVKYSAPSGFHDDCVCALALAYKCYVEKKRYGHYSTLRI